jgi:hypothetical protein
MSHERSLDALLLDILDDFETSLKTAKNGPARRRLAGQIDRIKLAIEQRDQSVRSVRPAAAIALVD